MNETLVTLVVAAILISALAGGVTYSAIMLFHLRTLLAGVRLGWFVVLFALVSIAFFRSEDLAGIQWVYPAAITIGVVVFVARDFARRSDLMVLHLLDLVFGCALLALVIGVIGPGSGIPMTALVPIGLLAMVAWGGHLFRRLYIDRDNPEGAARARLVKLLALGAMPLFLFGGLILNG